MKWPDGKLQGESLDLVQELDQQFSTSLFDSTAVENCIAQFRSIFPSKARPSSRAAFLFQGNGDPLRKHVFQDTLHGTDDLLGQTEGPFFCGGALSAADVTWAPFLERYRYQLPCLHEGLQPYNAKEYPNLAAWYDAMDRIPAYACRVKGDASSWRKVLSMAGFGNAGVPPQIGANMDEMAREEAVNAVSTIDQGLWTEYSSSRPYLAATPEAEAASIMTRNREAISADVLKRAGGSVWEGLPTTESNVDEALRAMVCVLIENDTDVKLTPHVGALAGFLDERMCVPRDMGAMSASAIKKLALEVSA